MSRQPWSPTAICSAVGLALALSGCGSSGLGPNSGPDPDDKPASEGASRSEQATSDEADLEKALAKAPEPGAGPRAVQPPLTPEPAPKAAPRLKDAAALEKLPGQVDAWFAAHPGRRIHIQVDKPLYTPGETIWIKTLDLKTRDLSGGAATGIDYTLVSPKGAPVLKKRVPQANGRATNDFTLPEGVAGGTYTLKVRAHDGVTAERPIVVSAYEPPRIKKKMEFVRKAYGAGDTVSATLEIKRPTGEPLPNHPLKGQITVDGEALKPVQTRTDAHGNAMVRFTLPGKISKGDGLLTVLVTDGGVTESISRPIPIIVDAVQLSFFPEGGQMVEGLPSRLYFEARTPLNKPADIEGRIVDDHGNPMATFSTFERGRGRVGFTPSPGRKYHAEITRPVGISARYPLPLSAQKGCVLRTYDDPDGQRPDIRVGVRCTEERPVVIVATQREQLLDAAPIQARSDVPVAAWLTPGALTEDTAQKTRLAHMQGPARITLFSLDEATGELTPMAERLFYRNRRGGMQVEISADQEKYTPREQVALKIKTTTPEGEPFPAELAVAVVDDTVLSFADDKTAHLLSAALLLPEIPGEVEEPNVYFDLTEPKGAMGLELLMGTRGWRKFEWRPLLAGPVVETSTVSRSTPAPTGIPAEPALEPEPEPVAAVALKPVERGEDRQAELQRGPVARPDKKPALARKPAIAPLPDRAKRAKRVASKRDRKAGGKRARREAPRAQGRAAKPIVVGRLEAAKAEEAMAFDEDVGGLAGAVAVDGLLADKEFADAAGEGFLEQERRNRVAWAPVRVFPAPDYSGAFSGPRTDFRETIHWAPAVKTGRDGEATVTFWLSDAVTSFRVTAEGVGLEGHMLGRHEEVITSTLPFNMSVKLPLEVSAGDTLELPLTLANETASGLGVKVNASFGDLLTAKGAPEGPLDGGAVQLAGGTRQGVWYPLEVTGQRGESVVRFAAGADGLSDELTRTVKISPRGFPQLAEASGTLAGTTTVTRELDLGEIEAGSVDARLTLYPSPVATLTSGLAGLIREPHGCFEQTSSTNYPNVMVLQYLETSSQGGKIADPKVIARAKKLIDKGYRRLTGFETKKKGYEWFGRAPAHEALTAYGLLEFTDMKAIYGKVDDEMMARTARWLHSRRDGKGGFKRDKKALDSFGRAAPEITNAYVTYSLAEAGLAKQFEAEIAAQAKAARTTKDDYILALAANTLLSVPARRAEGLAALEQLEARQGKDGAWKAAKHSITRSTGNNLHIETTALALLALMKDPEGGHNDALRRGVAWLNDRRGGYGRWGATQATVLALKAMTAYAQASARTKHPGSLTVRINGIQVAQMDYEAGRQDPLELHALGAHFKAGKNTIELVHKGEGELPFSLAADYRATTPATDPATPVALTTTLARDTLAMGETVRLTAKIENRTQEGQPMTLVRIGLPGGLTAQQWQLKSLKEKGIADFVETRAREVVVYFRQLKPGESREIPLDLVAMVPGRYTGPASSTYLYYTDDQKFWSEGLQVAITR